MTTLESEGIALPAGPGLHTKLGVGKNRDAGIRQHGNTVARRKALTFREKVIINFKNRGKEPKNWT